MTANPSKLTVRLPTNKKSALEKTAFERSTAHEKVSASEIAREAIDQWFQEQDQQNQLPEEVRDELDENLLADAGTEEGTA